MGALHNVTGTAPTLTDTARALVAHPRFRWQGGMLLAQTSADCAGRIVTDDGAGVIAPIASAVRLTDGDNVITAWSFDAIDETRDVPDLTDPATVGCLLADLLADDPTARLSIEPRESGHLVRLTVTAHSGRREALSGALLGDVLARGLLVCWGPA